MQDMPRDEHSTEEHVKMGLSNKGAPAEHSSMLQLSIGHDEWYKNCTNTGSNKGKEVHAPKVLGQDILHEDDRWEQCSVSSCNVGPGDERRCSVLDGTLHRQNQLATQRL